MEKKHKIIFLEDSRGIVKTIDKVGNLFIISDDEIKEGDNAYCELDKCVEKVVLKSAIIQRWKKIIATTDDSISGLYRGYEYQLPRPSDQFIEKYVESYNAGKPITDVLVEYEEIKYNSSGVPVTWSSEDNLQIIKRLKINPKDNTITIKRVKDSWNREELTEFLKNWRFTNPELVSDGRGEYPDVYKLTSKNLDDLFENI